MKIHIVPGIGSEASGPSYCVPMLCESLLIHDDLLELLVLKMGENGKKESYVKYFDLSRFYPQKIGLSYDFFAYFIKKIIKNKPNIVHSHGLWMFPNILPGFLAYFFNFNLVVSPHGCMTEYAFSIGSKFKYLYWVLIQKNALKKVKLFHATSFEEYKDIRRLGFKQPVAIIPWGISLPEIIVNTEKNKKHILYLGRIHPNKGLDFLVKIWAKLEKEFSDWELHIVGPETGFFDDETSYLNHLKNLCKTFSLKSVKFKKAVYGNEKNEHYQRASFTVLLSHSENFAMTVAESLACGTPSIVSKSAPWSGLDITNSGYWVDMDEETVLKAFKKAMSLDENEVALMGNNAREWMKKEFSWDNISEQFNQAYEWAANNSLTKPEFIKLD